MPESNSNLLHQMHFRSPEGRREVLWVESGGPQFYRVLSVPVWVYGISRGSVVEGEHTADSTLCFRRVVRNARGATIRFIVPDGATASEVYLDRILPEAKRSQIYIGPATFFDPRLVAVNIRQRADWWPTVGGYFDRLVQQGVLEQWEVADPDKYANEHEGGEVYPTGSSVLLHPLPVEGTSDQHLS